MKTIREILLVSNDLLYRVLRLVKSKEHYDFIIYDATPRRKSKNLAFNRIGIFY